MRKFNYLFGSLLIAAIMFSCSKESMTDNNDSDVALKAGVVYGPSLPISDAGIVPSIIEGENPGGNRTCAEVGMAFTGDAGYFDLCGEKIDYSDFDYDGDMEFAGAFPEGLNIKVEGNFISFEMSSCLSIEGVNYKVGAVIVKGSNAANVYFYPEGTLSDGGLAAPGGKRMVSNLSFCFVECTEEQPEWVIALKAQMIFPGLENPIGVSGGTDSDINSFSIGYNSFVPGTTNVYPFFNNLVQIGIITVSEVLKEDVPYLSVVVDTYSADWSFKHTYLYVGTLDGFNTYRTLTSTGRYQVAYYRFPFQKGSGPEPYSFEIPYSSITE